MRSPLCFSSSPETELFHATNPLFGRPCPDQNVPRGAETSRDVLERFESEGRAMSRRKEARVGFLSDWGSEGQTHFFVMKFAERKSMKDSAVGEWPLVQ